ncbi:MAG: anthranilate synthase component I family protein [Fibromonadaceae bacterium]|jgi:anthranilate synthase component 1|nr:anthranilate synthase component I family protein [Fibromonadaceae bacterium]
MQLREYPSPQEYKEMLSQKPSGASLVIPVGVKILADTETPVSVLSKFMGEGSLFLFESVEGGENWGRYSFLGFSPHLEIQIFREFVKVNKKGCAEEIPHNGEPLELLRKISSQYKYAELDGLPKFKGGLVGYFAYEMVSFFEPRVKSKLPPEQPLAHLILPEIVLAFDNVCHTLDIMSFAFSEDDFQNAKERLNTVVQKLSHPIPYTPNPIPQKSAYIPEPQMKPEDFRAMVEKIKSRIVAGDIIQCVPSQAFVCDAPPDLLELYRAQRFINPSPYLYFMKLGEITLVGSSPETMIRVEDGVATLRPIAGTRPRGKTKEEDLRLAEELLKDEKEIAEHVMLVDLGRNELGRIARAGTVKVNDFMLIERYSHVMHIVSNIKAELDSSYDVFDVLKAAFPAGTLSGAPKVKAMEIIAEHETRPRGNYGGAAGYLSFDGKMDFAICIRTAVVQNGKLTLQAGAGIVADSDPETERQETINKAKSVARALEML